MMNGLLKCVRADAESLEDELNQLKTWKTNMETKFNYSEKVRKELEQGAERVKKVMEAKDKEIKDLKKQLRQAKDAVVREYRDSEALIAELSISFMEGFDDALRQVREAYPDLDMSMVKIEDPVQPSVVPAASENTEELFEGAVLGDGESVQAQIAQVQAPPVKDETRQLVVVDEIEKNDDPQKEQFFF